MTDGYVQKHTRYYFHQNDELIKMTCELHNLPFEYGFRYKLDRQNRQMIDEQTGVIYAFDPNWNIF